MPPAYEFSPSSANIISASFPLKTSSDTMKSSGSLPPILALNIDNMFAISAGFINLA